MGGFGGEAGHLAFYAEARQRVLQRVPPPVWDIHVAAIFEWDESDLDLLRSARRAMMVQQWNSPPFSERSG